MEDIEMQLAILNDIEENAYISSEGLLENSLMQSTSAYRPPPKRRKTITSECQRNYNSESFLNRRIPELGDYISITFADGCRRYLCVGYDAADSSDADASLSFLKSHHPLLPNDLCKLVQNAEQLGKLRCPLATFESTPAYTTDDQLWSKKYEPTSYLDLISTEYVNRQLLYWLKTWNVSVFGVEFKPAIASAPVQSTHSREVGSDEHQQHVTKQEGELTITQLDNKDGRRPHYRIVLLSGSPGQGKTTLAHLIARHAGYQVVEINASDDRNPSAMRACLEAVVSRQTSLDASGGVGVTGDLLKPSCLIIDEIDGASPAAVEVLAEAAATPLTRVRKRGKKSLVLLRPVICICNDLYAPSLRALRSPGAFCYILRVPPIECNRLVDRLNSVARLENLNVDKRLLSTLAEISGRDIRSCLNTLQFAKATQMLHKRTPTMGELMSGLESSIKNPHHNLFSAWQAVFTIPSSHVLNRKMSQLRTSRQTSGNGSDRVLQARIRLTMEICDSTGEPSNLILGLFENYLDRKMNDASLQKALSASQWLQYSDRLMQHIQITQEYSLMRYVTLLPAWFHLAFASNTPPPIVTRWTGQTGASSGLRWPAAFAENAAAAGRTSAILASLAENQWRAGGASFALTSLRLLTHRQFLLDAASYLHKLVCTMSLLLRPVNIQLYSAHEKQYLCHLISLMITIGLDWSPQQATDTGESTYHLEPPLDAVAQFTLSTFKSPDLDALPYAIKQILARELAMERLRRAGFSKALPELMTGNQDGADAGGDTPFGTGIATNAARGKRKAASLPNSFMATRLAPTVATLNIPVEKKVRKDFFGRPIIEKTEKIESQENQPLAVKCPINEKIWFKFKEGHSNAVRRPFYMSHFIK